MLAYKYRGGYNFDRDLDSIAGDYFYAASLDKLNDPFEATYSASPIESFLQIVESSVGDKLDIPKVKEELQRVLDDVANAGIFSLAEQFDDLKLWAHYADSHRGFCVGYEVGLLKAFCGDSYYSHNILKVLYADKPADLNYTDFNNGVGYLLHKLVGIKHPDWAHEGEIRIITDKAGRIPHDFRAIKTIHFGLNMPKEQIGMVMRRMQGRGIIYYLMCRSVASYQIKAIHLEDPFTNAPPYLYYISPIAKHGLDIYTKGDKESAALSCLHKAVEIQRRDPYCTEVCYAEHCTDKDRIDQVYVNYRYNTQYYNRYFTKDELNRLYAYILSLES